MDQESKLYRVAINYENHGTQGFDGEFRGTVDEAIQFYGDAVGCQFVDKEEHDNGNVDLNYERPWTDRSRSQQSICVTLWPQEPEEVTNPFAESPYGGE